MKVQSDTTMKQFRLVTATILLLPFLQPSAVYAGQDASPSFHDIPRFHMVAKDLYRGGQPVGKGFEVLREKGVKTIINLRAKGDGEQDVVQTLGMKYFHIPLNAWKRVPEDAIRTFLQVLSEPDNYPVFIHCRRGADRTGMMVGLYRIVFQGWDADEAYKEAREMGMRWWYRNLKRQLYEFADRRGMWRETNSISKKSNACTGRAGWRQHGLCDLQLLLNWNLVVQQRKQNLL